MNQPIPINPAEGRASDRTPGVVARPARRPAAVRAEK